MARLPVPARIYSWSIIVSGTLLLVFTLVLWKPEAPDPLNLAGALASSMIVVAALVFVGLHPVLLAPNQKMNVGTVLMFGALLLLAPFPATALSVIGTGIHNVLIRRRWHNVLFNMAQHSLTVGAAALVFRTLDPDGDFLLADARDLLSGGAAALVYFFVSTSIVGFMVTLGHARPLAGTLMGLWRQSWVQYFTLMALGMAGSSVYLWEPLMLALAVPPLVLVHRSNEQMALIRETNQRLEEALQAQRRFVSDASHELRTPLTAIQGNVDLLLSGSPGGDGLRATLTDIARESNRLARLVADLLTLAQADEGMALNLEPTDLETLSYEVYRQLRPLAGPVNLRFALEETQDEGVIAWVDADRFRQLLGNLLDNAIKYTPAGGEVRVQVRSAEEWAQVEVADTGIGIPREHQTRIFERFYRVDTARARSSGGAGLGLAIARWIAEAHGGRLTVASEPGAGSAFTIWLPLRAR